MEHQYRNPKCSQYHWFFNLPLAKNMHILMWPWIMKWWVLGQECLKGVLLLQLCDHLFDFSLQTWRTHIAWCQFGALNVQQKTWGDKHSLWRCHDGFFLVTTSKWMFRSFLQFARRPFCHFTVQWEILITVTSHRDSAYRGRLTPKASALCLVGPFRNPSTDERGANMVWWAI